jgi:hypothetical protein
MSAADPVVLAIGAVTFLLSLVVAVRSNQINRQAREKLAARLKGDPEATAVLMGRLGWLERLKFAKELDKP